MRRWAALVVILLSFTVEAWGNEIFELGIPLPLTGKKSKVGMIDRQSYEIAADEINAAGGIRGKILMLKFEDSADDPEQSSRIAEQLIQAGQPVLVGEYTSHASRAIAAVAEERKIPYLIVTGAADDIAQQNYRYVFRLGPPASYYTSGLGAFLEKIVNAETMAIVHEDADFTTSVADGMRQEAARRQIDVVMEETHTTNTRDFRKILKDVKELAPDTLFMISYETGAAELMQQIKRRRLELKAIVGGGGGFAIPQFIQKAGDASEYFMTATLWSPESNYPGNRQYAETYKKRHGTYPSYHGAEAYAALYVIKDALERAAEWTPDAIRDALKATDMRSAFGPVKFEDKDGFQNQNFSETLVLQVLDGKFEIIWPPEAATRDYVYPVPGWKERE